MDWLLMDWFFVAVLVLASIGAVFFGFKMLFRLIIFIACLWAMWWAATNLGLIDEVEVKKKVADAFQIEVYPVVHKIP